MDSTIGLLMYTFNDTENIGKTLERFDGYVDEFCIMDQSNDLYHKVLLEQVEGYPVKIIRLMSLGILEPYHHLPLKIMNSRYIFKLNVNEEASEKLIKSLKGFNDHSAYWIRSLERPAMSSSWQLRIFRKDNIKFKGFIHEQGEVCDSVKIKGKEYYILQDSDLGNSGKVRRYMTFDMFERPLTYSYLSKKIPFIRCFIFHKNEVVSPLFFKLYLNGFYLYYKLLGLSSWELQFPLDYLKLEYSIMSEMDSDLLAMCINIYKELKEIGPISYLCLDDITYIKSITDKDFFDKEGLKIFSYLLYYRFTEGKCAPIIDKKALQKNPLYLRLIGIIEAKITSTLPHSRWSKLKQ
jgi:hypothetical protein